MRLFARLSRWVQLRERADVETAALNEDLYVWNPEYRSIRAGLQPTGYSDSRIQLPQRLYGEHPDRALVMYTNHDGPIAAGMGVCVDVDYTESCDYRVTGAEDWPGHKRVYLAWIPENRRG